MKKTLAKDTVRNIRKQIVSYISILVISLLAAVTYLGINYSGESIKENVSRFLSDANFRDAEIVSTYMITPRDIEAIRNVEGVSDIEGVYRIGCKVYGSEQVTGVMVVSLTERINMPRLIEGRMPTAVNECVIEPEVSSDTGLGIGDTISVLNDQHILPQYLNRCDYVITGIVRHPDHSCKKSITPGARYIMVLPEAFDSEALDGCFMAAELRITGTEQYRIIDDEYLDYVSVVLSRLESLADERAIIRYNEVRESYQDKINEGQASLDDAQVELNDARSELDQHWQEYYDGLDDLNDAQQQLSDAQVQLNDARSQLDQGASQLEDGRAQLDAAWAQLVAAREELDGVRNQLLSSWTQLEEAREQLDAYQAQIETGESTLVTAETQLAAAWGRLQEAEAQIQTGRQELQTSYAQIEEAKTTVRDAMRQAIAAVLGDDVANSIDWAQTPTDINIDDPNLSATLIPITNEITLDLTRPLDENILTLISSLGIPQEELRTAYESATGIILEETSENAVLQYIVNAVNDAFSGVTDKYNEYAESASAWNTYHIQYIDGVQLYNQGLEAYNSGLNQYLTGKTALEDGIEEYNRGRAQYNEGLAQYNDAYAQYLEGEAQYAAGLAEYNARLAEFEEAEAQYNEGRSRYEEGLEEYEEGLEQYQQGQSDLEEGLESLEEGESEFEEGVDRFNNGQERLQQAIDDLEMMDQCHWTILSAEGNAGYLQIRTDVSNVANMSGTLALVFILVGALVIYATVGRIIEEQRNLVGASKALGLYNREIFMKYLAFGTSATFIGEVLGIILGYFLLQRVYLYLYGANYTFALDRLYIMVGITIAVFIGGLAIASLTVWFACSTLLRSSVITLMMENVPNIKRKTKKSVSKGGKHSLYGSMILLNMLADKKRVFVTIISIAGCCTLLVTGMTINFNIKRTVDAEFRQIHVYDLEINYDHMVSDNVERQIENVLIQNNVSYIPVQSTFTSYDANGKLSGFLLMVADLDRLGDFYVRTDVNTNETVTGGGNGIWIFQQLANMMNVGVGDYITMYDSAMNPHKVNIEGVYTEYVQQSVIMSPQKYEEVFGKAPQYNTFYVNLNGVSDQEIIDSVSEFIGYTGSSRRTDQYQKAVDLTFVLDYISGIFVLAAGLMSYFILLNLINMYVHQKKLELTIMRINGFTVREVIYYVSLEIVVSTVLGIVLGLGLGSLLSYRVLSLLESISLHIMKSIQLESWGIAALITIVFTSFVSALALRNVKKLNMTDINNN